jgi:IclR family KDG regulon transcriptional repressor
MRRAASKNKYPVKSLVKALRILDVLAERPAGFGITELSEALHIGKSTVHRLLATLKEEGYVVTHPAGSRYILGGRIARLGQQLSDQYQLLSKRTKFPEPVGIVCFKCPLIFSGHLLRVL